MPDENGPNAVELAADITIAWLGNPNNQVAADEVPAVLRSVHQAVAQLVSGAGSSAQEATEEFPPAVSVRKSLASKDHIISMIDGKPYKMLRRHLTTHGLTPEEYRTRYNLKPDYPMVAPSYSEKRSAMAKTIGLGSKGRAAKAKSAAASAHTAPKRAPRKRADPA